MPKKDDAKTPKTGNSMVDSLYEMLDSQKQTEKKNKEIRERNKKIDEENEDNDKKGKKGKKKEKEKEETFLDKVLTFENLFKMFVIGMFLFGAPFTIGMFALGITGFLGKKAYNYLRDRKKNKEVTPKDILKGIINAAKKNCPGKEFDEKGLMALAYGDDGKELSMEEFNNKITGIAKGFLKSKEGQDLMKNPATKEVIKNSLGEDSLDKVNELEKEVEKENTKENTNPEVNNKKEVDNKELNNDEKEEEKQEPELDEKEQKQNQELAENLNNGLYDNNIEENQNTNDFTPPKVDNDPEASLENKNQEERENVPENPDINKLDEGQNIMHNPEDILGNEYTPTGDGIEQNNPGVVDINSLDNNEQRELLDISDGEFGDMSPLPSDNEISNSINMSKELDGLDLSNNLLSEDDLSINS